jgi:hypothetical protein
MTNFDVFVAKFRAYQLFYMSIKRLSPIIKTCVFSILHKDLHVTTPKQYPHCIEIRFSIIYHEPFEIHIQHTMFFNDLNERFPHQHL